MKGSGRKMNKELSPLEALEKITNYKCSSMSEKIECKEIIKTALKRLKIYENYDIDLDETDDVEKTLKLNARITIVNKVMDTQERLLTSVSSDEIRILSSVLNSQIKNLKKKLEALEIIKLKQVNIFIFLHSGDLETYNDIVEDDRKLTQQEYDLLKEALFHE